MLRSKLTVFPLAAVLSAGLLAGCGGGETVVEEAEGDGAVAEAAILGEPVTVQAQVAEVISPQVFRVGEGTPVVGAFAVEEGTEVQVTGVVRQFLVADLEDELGVDFDTTEEDFLAQYEQELGIVATDVEVVEPIS